MPNFALASVSIAHTHSSIPITGGGVRNLVMTITASLTLTDAESMLRNKNKTRADSLTLTDAESRLRNLLQVSSDSLTLVESISRLRNKIRTISDTLTFVDSITRLRGKIKTIADSLTLTSATSRLTTRLKTIAVSLTLTDSLSRLRLLLQLSSDSLSFVDTGPSRLRLLLQTFSDSVSISATHSRLRGFNKTTSDSLTISAIINRLKGRLKDFANSLTLTDSPYNTVKGKSRGFTDTLTLTDAVIENTARNKTVTESLTLTSDHVQDLMDRVRLISVSLTLSDSISRLEGKLRSISDSITITPTNPTETRDKLRTIAESLTLTHIDTSRIRNISSRTIAASLTLSSTTQRITNRIRAFSNTLTLTDTESRLRGLIQSISSSVSLVDVITSSRGKLKSISDSLTITHTSTSRITTHLRTITGQTLTLVDSIPRIKSVLKSTSTESLSFTDSQSKLRGLIQVIADSISFADIRVRSTTRTRTIGHSLSVVDSLVRNTARLRTISESLSLFTTILKIKNNGTPQPTRFYFHSAFSTITGILPTTNQSALAADYNIDDISNSRLMDTILSTRTQKVISKSISSTFLATSNYYVTRFVSPPLGQFSIAANTWKYSISAINTAIPTSDFAPTKGNLNPGPLNINVYVWRPSTGTKVGTIKDGNTANVIKYTDSHQRTAFTTFTGVAVNSMEQTDVLVVECWMHIYNQTLSNQIPSFYFDGPTLTTTDGAIVSNHAAYLETPETFSLSVLRNFSRDFSSSLGFIANAPIRLRGFVQTMSDSITLTTGAAPIEAKPNKVRLLNPILTLTDAISRRKPINIKQITHSLTISASHVRNITRLRTISDSLLMIFTLYKAIRVTKFKSIDHLLRFSDVVSKTQNNFKSFYIRFLKIKGDK